MEKAMVKLPHCMQAWTVFLVFLWVELFYGAGEVYDVKWYLRVWKEMVMAYYATIPAFNWILS
jgi:hypothetical protein